MYSAEISLEAGNEQTPVAILINLSLHTFVIFNSIWSLHVPLTTLGVQLPNSSNETVILLTYAWRYEIKLTEDQKLLLLLCNMDWQMVGETKI